MHFSAYEQTFPLLVFSVHDVSCRDEYLLPRKRLTIALNPRKAVFAASGISVDKMISGCEKEYRHSNPELVPNEVSSSCPK